MGLALSSRGGSVNDADKAVWFRQDSAEGESVMRAASRSDRGQRLAGVTVLQYDRAGHFAARIEAESAEFTPGGWTLGNGRIDRVGAPSETFKTRRLASSLTIEQVRDNLASPDTVPFWSLPRLVDTARNAGIPAFRYQLQYHVLLARPLLLCAMVVVAALVSLRVFRFGNIGALILSGVLAGFVLYVVNEISRDVGGAGLVAPPDRGLGTGGGRIAHGADGLVVSGGWLMDSGPARHASTGTARLRSGARRTRLASGTAMALLAALAFASVLPHTATAQTKPAKPALATADDIGTQLAKGRDGQLKRMVLEADLVTYNNDKPTSWSRVARCTSTTTTRR